MIQVIKEGDVVFIDEIASLQLRFAEWLYPVLQDFQFYASSNSIQLTSDFAFVLDDKNNQRIEVPRCTFIGATTDLGKVPGPLRDRFRLLVELDPLSENELAQVALKRDRVKDAPGFDSYIGQDLAKGIVKTHINALGTKIERVDKDAALNPAGVSHQR